MPATEHDLLIAQGPTNWAQAIYLLLLLSSAYYCLASPIQTIIYSVFIKLQFKAGPNRRWNNCSHYSLQNCQKPTYFFFPQEHHHFLSLSHCGNGT